MSNKTRIQSLIDPILSDLNKAYDYHWKIIKGENVVDIPTSFRGCSLDDFIRLKKLLEEIEIELGRVQ